MTLPYRLILLLQLAILGLAMPLIAAAQEGYHFQYAVPADHPMYRAGWSTRHNLSQIIAPPVSQVFRAGEFQVESFALAVSDDLDADHVDYGAGVGVGYYITRQFGIRAATLTTDERDNLVDQVSLSIEARQPIADRLAPYIFLGADYQTEEHDWLGHAGAGLELRAHRNVGLFVDARYQTDFASVGEAVGRAGLRVSF